MSISAAALADHHYRRLFESAPGSFVVLEPVEYRIVAVTDDYLRLTMRTREQLLGHIFTDAFPDEPGNAAKSGTGNLLQSLQRVKQTLTRDVIAIQRHPIVNPVTGVLEERYWAPVNTPVLDDDGQPCLIIHSTQDITDFVRDSGRHDSAAAAMLAHASELKQLNEQLHQSQQRLQAIFRNASIGMAVTDLNGRFTDANDAFCRMLGYSLDELTQLDIYVVTHPDERDMTRQLREQTQRESHGSFCLQKRYLTKDGSTVWCSLSVSQLRDSEDRLTHMIAVAEDITPRRQAEEALRVNRMLERSGSRIARVGGWIADYTGDSPRVHWADGVYEIFEYEGNGPPALDAVLELLDAHNRSALAEAFRRCRESGAAMDLELEMTTFKGNVRWIHVVGEPEYDAAHNVVCILGATQDITRQKHEQQRTRQLSSQLLATLESMSDAFYMLDHDWRFLYLNAGAERILRIKRSDVLGHVVWDKFPGFRDSAVHHGCLHARSTGETWRAELYVATFEDWLNITVYNTAQGFAVYFHSTGAERSLESRIVESERRLRHIISATLDIAWDIDVESGKFWVNEGLRDKLGYAIDSGIVDNDFWVGHIHPDDRDEVTRHYAELLAGNGNEWSMRYRFEHANGSYVYLEDRGWLIRDAAGKPLHITGGSTDITRRLEMEEQLQQSQRLDAVGQLTGGIAHDFNNLLTVILGNAYLLHEQLDDRTDLQELTAVITHAGNRGAMLTSHLLAFSRKQTLQPQSIDINLLLKNLQGMLKRTLGENVIIQHRETPGLWSAFIDPNQLEIALLNLCLNSRDAMPNGGTVTLETANVQLDEVYSLSHSDVQPGNYVLLSVSDTGTGIAPEMLDKVFEPFFTTKEKHKGTGLGLSTVFGFIKQSNGHINLYSELGRGTTIKIYLPRSSQAVEQPVAAPTDSAVIGGSETILLVEDNELVRQFSTNQLRRLGYTVLPAADAAEALPILRTHGQLDLLFTDIVMPGMDGRELARLAQQMQPGIRLLFASGFIQEAGDRSQTPLRGQLLQKPYKRSALAAKVREVLDAPPDLEGSPS